MVSRARSESELFQMEKRVARFKHVETRFAGMPCVGLDWFVPFFFASNRTGPVHFQTCIGLNRIDPGAALLYNVPDCTGSFCIMYRNVPVFGI